MDRGVAPVGSVEWINLYAAAGRGQLRNAWWSDGDLRSVGNLADQMNLPNDWDAEIIDAIKRIEEYEAKCQQSVKTVA